MMTRSASLPGCNVPNAILEILDIRRTIRVSLKHLAERDALLGHKTALRIAVPRLLARDSGIGALHGVEVPYGGIGAESRDAPASIRDLTGHIYGRHFSPSS